MSNWDGRSNNYYYSNNYNYQPQQQVPPHQNYGTTYYNTNWYNNYGYQFGANNGDEMCYVQPQTQQYPTSDFTNYGYNGQYQTNDTVQNNLSNNFSDLQVSNVSQRSGANRLYRRPHSLNNANKQNLDQSKIDGRKKLLANAQSILNGKQSKNNTQRNENDSAKTYTGWAHQEENWRELNTRKLEELHKKIDKTQYGQRETLIEDLSRNKLECSVCCETLRHRDPIWSCPQCYHVLHLRCVRRWANANRDVESVGGKWRCVACQAEICDSLDSYYCFCRKMKDPPVAPRGELPHSCGDVCSKQRKFKDCTHRCNILCHPGPCPPCQAYVERRCGCGTTSQQVKCSSTQPIVCLATCGKLLSCCNHYCEQNCHEGECESCPRKIKQNCYCKKMIEIETNCGESPIISCEEICNGNLSCGKHVCKKKCHEGSCGDCSLIPELVNTCHCGAKEANRNSCSDPVPSCGGKCPKGLEPCSHPCPDVCHPSPCSPCQVIRKSTCGCESSKTTYQIVCSLLESGIKPKCKKKCVKTRSCGRHRCNQTCCTDQEHRCPIVCQRTLNCSRHKCSRLCHMGQCLPCPIESWTELTCTCGSQVIPPPVPCGTKPPHCTKPCSRQHPCGHEQPTHNCHSETTCPPCTVLVRRSCLGGHEIRTATPCFQGGFSCGRACGKKLPCGHSCITKCHSGECNITCTQPCSTPRKDCPHQCGAPCHPDTNCCPKTLCNASILTYCPCNRRSTYTVCHKVPPVIINVPQGIQSSTGGAVNNPTLQKSEKIEPARSVTLTCNEECEIYQRNLRLAIGLQIVNPDLSLKLKPTYSEFLKLKAKRSPKFCEMIHTKLTELVQLAKESKQKSRSYSFDPMNRDKRQFIHEYCKHFGCESAAYDEEPKRNVVATAVKDKCWLPSYSLLEVVERENGHRKVPIPTFRKDEKIISAPVNLTRNSSLINTTINNNNKPTDSTASQQSTSSAVIDWFEWKN